MLFHLFHQPDPEISASLIAFSDASLEIHFFDRLFFTFGGHFEKVKTSFESLPLLNKISIVLIGFCRCCYRNDCFIMEKPDVF
jgi:hypothetical protein